MIKQELTAKRLILQGSMLGATAGLVVTFFDGLFMILVRSYAPLSYPLLLITFNTVLWTAVGLLSGIFLWTVCHKREDFREKENIYWVVFFLLPFAVLYGLLGRLYLHVSIFSINLGAPVFDRHLSFVWVAGLLVFLVFFFKRQDPREKVPVGFFCLEITVIIILYVFCSDLKFLKAQLLHAKLSGFLPLDVNQFLILFYCGGVSAIIGSYVFLCIYIRPALQKKSLLGGYRWLVVGSAYVLVSLAACYGINHERSCRDGVSFDAPTHSRGVKQVPYFVLIVLDTVRADRLSVYGNSGTTDVLEAFVKEALVFDNCVATSSWTAPSHASLFTGYYPVEHGSHGDLDPENTDPFGFPNPLPLAEEVVTLAEVFYEHGYKTAGTASNPLVFVSDLKYDQGFMYTRSARSIGELYETFPFSPILHLFCFVTNTFNKYALFYRTADEITSESIGFVEAFLPEPFFLFMNYNDAHGPYLPPRPYSDRFLEKTFPHLYRLKLNMLRLFNKLDSKTRDAYQITQYDGELAYIDAQLGTFFSRLKEMGIYDEALIIITSDHGELFGEQGLYWHKSPLYRGAVNVPLMIKFPFSSRVGREKGLLSLCDLYPIILATAGLPVPASISCRASRSDSAPVVAEFYDYGLGEHRVIYDGHYKYMTYDRQRTSELYDIESDPMETENLVHRYPEIAARMLHTLQQWRQTHQPVFGLPGREKETVSDEAMENLKALEYIK